MSQVRDVLDVIAELERDSCDLRLSAYRRSRARDVVGVLCEAAARMTRAEAEITQRLAEARRVAADIRADRDGFAVAAVIEEAARAQKDDGS